MWAGGGFDSTSQSHVCENVTRTNTVESLAEKEGGSGRMVFVRVRHDVDFSHGRVLTEEHDIVYRGDDEEAVKSGYLARPVDVAAAQEVRPDLVQLFRYSALTVSDHRVHYDAITSDLRRAIRPDRARTAAGDYRLRTLDDTGAVCRTAEAGE
jgi:3-methylfumaryl-CoA hydratase